MRAIRRMNPAEVRDRKRLTIMTTVALVIVYMHVWLVSRVHTILHHAASR